MVFCSTFTYKKHFSIFYLDILVTLYFKVSIIQSNYLVKYLVVAVVLT